MLIRQKTLLALLLQANKSLSPTIFVKLVFLLRYESELSDAKTFYNFVPYRFGPFSFALYRELTNLRRDGYISPDIDHISLCEETTKLSREKADELPASVHKAIQLVVKRYGKQNQSTLLKDVYLRYSWFATKSELQHLLPKSINHKKKARIAVYTAGYEGKSVDSFFNDLLKQGIQTILDVRANPISRQYGFAKSRLSEIGKKLGFDYYHMGCLGIPRSYRLDLSDYNSYQRLMAKYEHDILPNLGDEIDDASKLIQQQSTVLVCVEKDVRCCHRSRLAEAISKRTGLDMVHLI